MSFLVFLKIYTVQDHKSVLENMFKEISFMRSTNDLSVKIKSRTIV